MVLEKITIGKIRDPNVFYFVSFDGDENVYKDQVRKMKDFFNHGEGQVRPPSFIKRLILSGLESIPERYGGWNVKVGGLQLAEYVLSRYFFLEFMFFDEML